MAWREVVGKSFCWILFVSRWGLCDGGGWVGRNGGDRCCFWFCVGSVIWESEGFLGFFFYKVVRNFGMKIFFFFFSFELIGVVRKCGVLDIIYEVFLFF